MLIICDAIVYLIFLAVLCTQTSRVERKRVKQESSLKWMFEARKVQNKINKTLNIIVLFSVKSRSFGLFAGSLSCSWCFHQFISYLEPQTEPGAQHEERFFKTLDLSFIFLSFFLGRGGGNDKCFRVRRQTSKERWMARNVENKFPFLLNFAVITFMSYSFFSLLPQRSLEAIFRSSPFEDFELSSSNKFHRCLRLPKRHLAHVKLFARLFLSLFAFFNNVLPSSMGA